MKVKFPYYLVVLVVGLVYGVLKTNFPDLPFSQEAVLWVVLTVLTALNVDVVTALRAGRSIR